MVNLDILISISFDSFLFVLADKGVLCWAENGCWDEGVVSAILEDFGL